MTHIHNSYEGTYTSGLCRPPRGRTNHPIYSTKIASQRVSEQIKLALRASQNFWPIRVRITPCICLFSQHFCISNRERGASADAARHCAHELRPHGCQTDKQAPQKCREGPCTAFRSRARLYMDAVSMAKPRRRDVMGKENNSTSYEPCDARSCSSSFRPRGDRFSACRLSESVMHILFPLYTASRGFSRVGAALGSD